MYRLETSTGLQISATTVESVVSALTRQLDDHRIGAGFRWSVTTPHGTVLSDDIPADVDPADGPTVAAAGVEHAYGLLVRDHLTHGPAVTHAGLLRTS
jgi:hypothetical protein